MENEFVEKTERQHIAIVGSDFAFPFGGAASSRVRCLALGMLYHGADVRVLHLNCSERIGNKSRNSQAKGCFRGVNFEYTPGTTTISSSFVIRRFNNIVGLVRGMYRLWCFHRSEELDWVYLYDRDAKVVVPIVSLCRLLKIPVVLELNEWLPAMPKYGYLQRFIFRKFTLRQIQGIVAISVYLKDEVRRNNIFCQKQVPILMIPILVESDCFEILADDNEDADLYILWCGDLNAYARSAFFLVEVLASLCTKIPEMKLFLVGNVSPSLLGKLDVLRSQLSIPDDHLICTGYVDDERLIYLYKHAFALMLPLFLDEKDLARFPTKAAEYFMSGRPVITTRLGEIVSFVEDGVNAILVNHNGGSVLFADKVINLFNNPKDATRVGLAGLQMAKREFDNLNRGLQILQFAESLNCKSDIF